MTDEATLAERDALATQDLRTAESDLGLARCSIERAIKAPRVGPSIRPILMVIDALLRIVALERQRIELEDNPQPQARRA